MSAKIIINGVEVEKVNQTIDSIRTDPELARYNFHISNKWINGGHNRATISDFYGAKQEMPHSRVFELDEDEPAMLAGTGLGPSPVEYLLSALSGCMTSALIYHAALRGIHIETLECQVEGDIDLQGFLGVSDTVRNGYQAIRVTFKVGSTETNVRRWEALSKLAPSYETILNGTPIDVRVEQK